MKVKCIDGIGTVDQSRSDLINYWVTITDGLAEYSKHYPVVECEIIEMEDECK